MNKELTREHKDKLIRVYGRLNRPSSGVSTRAKNVTYNKQLLLDAIEELKEVMCDHGFKFEKDL
jgi:hypothetical protein